MIVCMSLNKEYDKKPDISERIFLLFVILISNTMSKITCNGKLNSSKSKKMKINDSNEIIALLVITFLIRLQDRSNLNNASANNIVEKNSIKENMI